MEVRMVNMSVKDSALTSFDTLIVTDWDDTHLEGIPDIIPLEGLRDRPVGRDPEIMEKEGSYPSTVGEIENGSFLDRTYVELG